MTLPDKISPRNCAGGPWEPGSERELIERRRIGPVVRTLQRETDPQHGGRCNFGACDAAGLRSRCPVGDYKFAATTFLGKPLQKDSTLSTS